MKIKSIIIIIVISVVFVILFWKRQAIIDKIIPVVVPDNEDEDKKNDNKNDNKKEKNPTFPLKEGSKGEEVKNVQRFLTKSQYLSKGNITGYWGTKTTAAFKKCHFEYPLTEIAYKSIIKGHLN